MLALYNVNLTMLDYIFQNFLPEMFKEGATNTIFPRFGNSGHVAFMWRGWNWGLLRGAGASVEAPGDVDHELFCSQRDP